MATLAADKPRVLETHDGFTNELPIVAADIIYAGAAVGELNDAGTYQPLGTSSSIDKFAGFAVERCDNSAGAASAKNVKVAQKGRVRLSVTGVTAATDVGKDVYATDDDTFTLTATAGVVIGKVVRWEVGTNCIVEFKAFYLRQSVNVTIPWNAASVDIDAFVANRPYRVRAINSRVTAAGTDAGAVTAVVKKAPSGTAIASGTALHTSSINLKGTANTNQAMTLSATASDDKIAPGDTIGVDFTGVLTAATGVVTLELQPL